MANILEYKRARFATQLPLDYLYSPEHCWIVRQEDGLWRSGLTRFGTRLIGETVDHGFLVEPGETVVPGQIVGWVEGFKAVSDLLCIASGKFAGGNPALEADITLINRDPYGAGWLWAVKGQPEAKCLDAQAYAKHLDQVIDRMLERQRECKAQ